LRVSVDYQSEVPFGESVPDDAAAGGAGPPPASAGEALSRYRRLRARVGRVVPSNYDISDRCNLRCEGCLFFEGSDRLSHLDSAGPAQWDDFFAGEARRGVNFAYLAGAEPALELDRVRLARRHIPHGVIFTNGTRRIPDEIDYRIHVSIWGAPAANARLRGADNAAKAMRFYAGDPRAVFVYTISRGNIGDIYETARALHGNRCTMTFSYFSPTTSYLDKLAVAAPPSAYFRVSNAQDNLILGPADFAAARIEIERALRDFPRSIRYSLDYDDWIAGPAPYVIDETTGIATNCGNRLTPRHHHFAVDLTRSAGKCCSPNIDCRSCRAYAQGYGSYLTRFAAVRHDPERLDRWLAVWETWADLFLPRPRPG
jgi:hypothetical protein